MTRDAINLTKKLVRLYNKTSPDTNRGLLKRRKLRILLSRISIENFITIYFSNDFSYSFSMLKKMDIEKHGADLKALEDKILFNATSHITFDIFDKIVHDGTPRCFALAEPRGFGKSTRARMLVTYSVAMKAHKLILYFGNNADLSQRLLNNVKIGIASNKLLRQDFPHLAPKRHAMMNKAEEYSMKAVAYQEAWILAGYSNKTSVRGLNIAGFRPDLIIIDDLESKKECHSPSLRQALKEWFEQDLLRLGGNVNPSIVMMGTIFSGNSLIDDIINKKEYLDFSTTSFRFPAIDEYGQSIWPEIWPLERLEEEKQKIGSFAFASEFLCDPIPSGEQAFSIENINKYSYRPDDLTTLDKDNLVCFMDLRTGIQIKNQSDYSPIVLCYKDGPHYYVIDANITKRKINNTKKFLLDYQKKWGFQILGIESNQVENTIEDIKDMFIDNHIFIIIDGIHHSSNKEIRILTYLQGLIESGRMRFRNDYRQAYPIMIEQLIRFPMADHDDAPDALAGCVEMANKYLFDIRDFTVERQVNDNNTEINNLINEKQKENDMQISKLMELKNELEWEDIRLAVDDASTIRRRAQYNGTIVQYLQKNGDITGKFSYCAGGGNIYQGGGIWEVLQIQDINEFTLLRELAIKENGNNGGNCGNGRVAIAAQSAMEVQEPELEPVVAKPVKRPAGKPRPNARKKKK